MSVQPRTNSRGWSSSHWWLNNAMQRRIVQDPAQQAIIFNNNAGTTIKPDIQELTDEDSIKQYKPKPAAIIQSVPIYAKLNTKSKQLLDSDKSLSNTQNQQNAGKWQYGKYYNTEAKQIPINEQDEQYKLMEQHFKQKFGLLDNNTTKNTGSNEQKSISSNDSKSTQQSTKVRTIDEILAEKGVEPTPPTPKTLPANNELSRYYDAEMARLDQSNAEHQAVTQPVYKSGLLNTAQNAEQAETKSAESTATTESVATAPTTVSNAATEIDEEQKYDPATQHPTTVPTSVHKIEQPVENTESVVRIPDVSTQGTNYSYVDAAAHEEEKNMEPEADHIIQSVQPPVITTNDDTTTVPVQLDRAKKPSISNIVAPVAAATAVPSIYSAKPQVSPPPITPRKNSLSELLKRQQSMPTQKSVSQSDNVSQAVGTTTVHSDHAVWPMEDHETMTIEAASNAQASESIVQQGVQSNTEKTVEPVETATTHVETSSVNEPKATYAEWTVAQPETRTTQSVAQSTAADSTSVQTKQSDTTQSHTDTQTTQPTKSTGPVSWIDRFKELSTSATTAVPAAVAATTAAMTTIVTGKYNNDNKATEQSNEQNDQGKPSEAAQEIKESNAVPVNSTIPADTSAVEQKKSNSIRMLVQDVPAVQDAEQKVDNTVSDKSTQQSVFNVPQSVESGVDGTADSKATAPSLTPLTDYYAQEPPPTLISPGPTFLKSVQLDPPTTNAQQQSSNVSVTPVDTVSSNTTEQPTTTAVQSNDSSNNIRPVVRDAAALAAVSTVAPVVKQRSKPSLSDFNAITTVPVTDKKLSIDTPQSTNDTPIVVTDVQSSETHGPEPTTQHSTVQSTNTESQNIPVTDTVPGASMMDESDSKQDTAKTDAKQDTAQDRTSTVDHSEQSNKKSDKSETDNKSTEQSESGNVTDIQPSDNSSHKHPDTDNTDEIQQLKPTERFVNAVTTSHSNVQSTAVDTAESYKPMSLDTYYGQEKQYPRVKSYATPSQINSMKQQAVVQQVPQISTVQSYDTQSVQDSNNRTSEYENETKRRIAEEYAANKEYKPSSSGTTAAAAAGASVAATVYNDSKQGNSADVVQQQQNTDTTQQSNDESTVSKHTPVPLDVYYEQEKSRIKSKTANNAAAATTPVTQYDNTTNSSNPTVEPQDNTESTTEEPTVSKFQPVPLDTYYEQEKSRIKPQSTNNTTTVTIPGTQSNTATDNTNNNLQSAQGDTQKTSEDSAPSKYTPVPLDTYYEQEKSRLKSKTATSTGTTSYNTPTNTNTNLASPADNNTQQISDDSTPPTKFEPVPLDTYHEQEKSRIKQKPTTNTNTLYMDTDRATIPRQQSNSVPIRSEYVPPRTPSIPITTRPTSQSESNDTTTTAKPKLADLNQYYQAEQDRAAAEARQRIAATVPPLPTKQASESKPKKQGIFSKLLKRNKDKSDDTSKPSVQRQRSAESQQWLQNRKYDYHNEPNWHLNSENTQQNPSQSSNTTVPTKPSVPSAETKPNETSNDQRKLAETNALPLDNGTQLTQKDEEQEDQEESMKQDNTVKQNTKHSTDQSNATNNNQQSNYVQSSNNQSTNTVYNRESNTAIQTQPQPTEPVFNRVMNAYSGTSSSTPTAATQPNTFTSNTPTIVQPTRYTYSTFTYDSDEEKTPVVKSTASTTTTTPNAAENKSIFNTPSKPTSTAYRVNTINTSALPASQVSGTVNNKMAEYARLIREQYLGNATTPATSL